jgi:hypothetical protein
MKEAGEMNIEIFIISTLYWVSLFALCMWLGRRLSKLSKKIEELETK